MKRKLALTIAMVLFISVFAVGCNGGGSSTEKTLIVRAMGDPQSFNPNTTADDNAFEPEQNIYNRLVELDTSKQIIGDLAEDWNISDDGLTMTFNLKKNAKWHDGKPLTSADVVYTFNYILKEKTYFLNPQLASVKSVEAKDDYTVVFNMKSPDVSLIGYLGWYGSFILPKHIFDNGQKWEDNPASKEPKVGSGPFKFESFKQGESITLTANKEYHDGVPKIGKLIFKIIPDEATAVQALVNKEIDVLQNFSAAEVENAKKNPDLRLDLNVYPSPMMFIFKLSDPILKDKAVRTAIATALNKEEISKKASNGIMEPEYNMYPSIVEWASNSEKTSPHYDKAKAEKILVDAGYKKDKDGYYIKGLAIDVFEGYGYPEAAKVMQSNLKDIGIDVKVNVMEFNAWNQKIFVEKDFQMAISSGFQGPDPAALASRVGTNGNMNLCGYSNKEVDKMFAEAIKTGDKEKRAKYYKDIQAILAEDLPTFPVIKFSAYDAASSSLINLPIDGEGKWGWQEYTFTEFK